MTPTAAHIEYVAGDAEHVPLATASAVLVLAAQSIQWFHRAAFLAEAARVLRWTSSSPVGTRPSQRTAVVSSPVAVCRAARSQPAPRGEPPTIRRRD